MTSKEKIEKAWELVNSKHIETNDEIQLVRFAVRTARELVERDTAKKPYDIFYNHKNKYKRLYTCPYCRNVCLKKYQNERQLNNYCGDCGQKIDWSE